MSTNVSSCLQSRVSYLPLDAEPIGAPMYYYSYDSARSPSVSPVFSDVPQPRTLTPDTDVYNNSDLMSDKDLMSLCDDQLTLHDCIDRALLDYGFDLSCLEELDEQLLLAPLEAFAAVCWAEAVDKDDCTVPWRWGYSDTQEEIESDTESEDTEIADFDTPTDSRWHWQDKRVSLESGYRHDVEESRNSVEIETRQGRRISFILLTPPSAMSDPKYSVQYFPKSPRKTKTKFGLRRLADGILAGLDSS